MHDFHVHTYYSNDCSAPIRDMVDAAIKANLEGLCLTDHCDIAYPPTYQDENYRYEDYQPEVQKYQEKYKGKIEIRMGIELGMQPSIVDRNREYLQGKTFDFIIGSIHAVGKQALYGEDYLEGITEEQGIINYFDDLALCIKDTDLYDVVGHIDGVRRYLRTKWVGAEEEAKLFRLMEEPLTQCLKEIIQLGKGIELNTSGLRYGLGAFHPMNAILKRYKELGGEIITIGSDSHYPQHVGYSFKEARELLLSLGFKYYSLFTNRKAEFKPL